MTPSLVRASTNVDSVPIRIADTAGNNITDVASLPSDLTFQYFRSNSGALTPFTLTTPGILGAPVSGSLTPITDGMWQLGLPVAVKASGDWVVIYWSGSNIQTGAELRLPIVAFDENSDTGGLDVEKFKATGFTVATDLVPLVTTAQLTVSLAPVAKTTDLVPLATTTQVNAARDVITTQLSSSTSGGASLADITTVINSARDQIIGQVPGAVVTQVNATGNHIKVGTAYNYTQNSEDAANKRSNVTVTT